MTEKIQNLIKDKDLAYSIKVSKNLPETHIFDENLTIKENRELIEKHNQNCVSNEEERLAKIEKARTNLETEIYSYLSKTHNVSTKKAKFAYEQAYLLFDSSTHDTVSYAYDLLDFHKKISTL